MLPSSREIIIWVWPVSGLGALGLIVGANLITKGTAGRVGDGRKHQ
jgi:uncharacterized membrane protein HdeD (DUF308 family)